MDDSLIVGRGQALRNLDCVVHGLANGKRAGPEALAQRYAVKELEHEIGVAIVLARIEDRDQVGVVEGTGGLRLLFETTKAAGVA
jgi:hypothetical protein